MRSAPLLLLLLLPFLGCSVGAHHPSDQAMLDNYRLHQSEFAELLVRLRSDDAVEMVAFDSARARFAASPSSGLQRERLTWYRQRMTSLGLVRIFRHGAAITLQVTGPSLFNGDSTKSYLFAAAPACSLHSSLDRYRLSSSSGQSGASACCLIAPGFYLLLSFA